MKFKNIIIFTKTLWSEPPRMRHQLAKLLVSYGHNIIFFERSSIKAIFTSRKTIDNIKTIRHFELIHHQLRPYKLLININNAITKHMIRKELENTDIDLIINFNYDYSFLKSIFPDKKIITIINDDFIAQGKKWMHSSIYTQLKNTCTNSDVVFTVSYPLHKKLLKFNRNTYLFFPWAEKKYQYPKTDTQRSVVLYWGYINDRIDWSIIEYLLSKGVKLRFIGKIVKNTLKDIEKYKKYDNFELVKPHDLSMANLDDVCCSILPYKTDTEALKVVTISNRAFQLLSYGIPLVYAALPNLLYAPEDVIKKCFTEKEYLEAIKNFTKSFASIQPKIENFLKNHYSEKRYNYFLKKIDKG